MLFDFVFHLTATQQLFTDAASVFNDDTNRGAGEGGAALEGDGGDSHGIFLSVRGH